MCSSSLEATCCIAGGGPAGLMLGYLLARAGIEVLVLEKHADFLRDFRGDTVHPSTLELMHELGILEEFLRLPHQRVAKVRALIGDTKVVLNDMTCLRTRCKFVALMPQWNFLNFLAEHAQRYPTFRLMMQTEVKSLIEDQGRIAGVQANTPDGPIEIGANLVVAADGRTSVLRERAGLAADEIGAPADVLWMRLSKHSDDPEFFVYANRGRVLVLLDRGVYWQCGVTIAKLSASETRARGIEALRASIVENAPFLRDRVTDVRDWNDVKLLTVRVDRLRQWYRPGLLCIGDAAHAMSPIGASELTWQYRMPSQRPTSWLALYAVVLLALTISRGFSAAANSLPSSRNKRKPSCAVRSLGIQRIPGLARFLGQCAYWNRHLSHGGCARALLASVFGPST